MILQRTIRTCLPEDICEKYSDMLDYDCEYHIEVTIEQTADSSYNLEQCLVYYDVDADKSIDVTDDLSISDRDTIIEKVLDEEEYIDEL